MASNVPPSGYSPSTTTAAASDSSATADRPNLKPNRRPAGGRSQPGISNDVVSRIAPQQQPAAGPQAPIHPSSLFGSSSIKITGSTTLFGGRSRQPAVQQAAAHAGIGKLAQQQPATLSQQDTSHRTYHRSSKVSEAKNDDDELPELADVDIRQFAAQQAAVARAGIGSAAPTAGSQFSFERFKSSLSADPQKADSGNSAAAAATSSSAGSMATDEQKATSFQTPSQPLNLFSGPKIPARNLYQAVAVAKQSTSNSFSQVVNSGPSSSTIAPSNESSVDDLTQEMYMLRTQIAMQRSETQGLDLSKNTHDVVPSTQRHDIQQDGDGDDDGPSTAPQAHAKILEQLNLKSEERLAYNESQRQAALKSGNIRTYARECLHAALAGVRMYIKAFENQGLHRKIIPCLQEDIKQHFEDLIRERLGEAADEILKKIENKNKTPKGRYKNLINRMQELGELLISTLDDAPAQLNASPAFRPGNATVQAGAGAGAGHPAAAAAAAAASSSSSAPRSISPPSRHSSFSGAGVDDPAAAASSSNSRLTTMEDFRDEAEKAEAARIRQSESWREDPNQWRQQQ